MNTTTKLFLGGINGVGKTTLASLVQELRPLWQVVHVSKEYMKFLNLPEGAYDQLRSLPESSHRASLRQLVNNLLVAHADTPVVILDAHYVVFDQAEYPILKVGEWIKEFDGLILVEAKAEDIDQRVHHDTLVGVRQRYMSSEASSRIGIIEENLLYNRIMAQRVSDWFGVDLFIVSNANPRQAANEIINIIESSRAKGLKLNLCSN